MTPLAPLLLALLAGPAPRPVAPAPAPRAPPRLVGTVAGQLRHKGCQSNPAGAVISVIGREASTTTDGAGRFTLQLPPGTYSLVIDGQNLVSDQRVDDVAISIGQTRDLGTVVVWPEERPANCGTPEPARPASEPVVAVTPETPSLDMPGDHVAPATALPEQVWVRASPGTGAGQLGVQGNPSRADEDALGPPSFAVGPSGSLWVLDALNRRVVRFDPRGHAFSTFPVAHAPEGLGLEADVGVTEDGHVFLFHAGETPVLSEYDNAGKLLIAGVLPPSFRGVSQLSCARARPFFLMQNGQVVRVELSWGGLKGDGPLPGLPVGDLYVRAERTGRFRAAVKMASGDGRVRRSVQMVSRVPITGVRIVGADRRTGDLVVAVDRADRGESGPQQAEVLLLSLTPMGRLGGTRAVPPGARRFEFREFALAPDGSVVQMQSDAAEVRFVRWSLLPPPPAAAGEGILRGRVIENGRPALGATVTLGRGRRTITVASDGTFEVRVPAGTYSLAVRPVATPGSPEPLSADVRAVVAPGATVDIGNVAVPPRIPARPDPLPAVP